jgi:tetratricopeptide (TPR) repeat protein
VGAGLCHVHLRGWQAVILSELGRFEEALRLADEAFDRAESVVNIFSMTFARLSIARVQLLRGDFERALQHLESGFDLVETYDIGLVRRMFVVWLPVAYAELGRPESAVPLVSQGPPQWPITHIARAQVLLAAGRAADATAAAEEALVAARRIGEQTQETIALLVLAETLARENRSLELARSYCEAALGIATSLGLRAYEAHGHRQLGELLSTGADREKARHHLTRASALYRDMGMQRWVGPVGSRLNSLDVQ